MKITQQRPTYVIAAGLALAVPALAGLMADAADDKAPGSLTAMEILKKSDDFHYGYDDSHRTIKVISKDKDGEKKEMIWEMWEKGMKRLILFNDPPELKGMALLVKDMSTVYIYEPELNKVRKIANHAKKQTMFGMDYSTDEMATFNLHKFYDPKILEEDSEKAVLLLEQKASEDKAWPILKLTVDKVNHWAAVNIEYQNEQGKKKKTEVRKSFKKKGGRWITEVMVMTDHAKKHSTTLVQVECEYNKGLEDEMFTKRFLIREE